MDDREYDNRSFPIREDMTLQRATWRFERIGWFVLLVLIGLTLAGLFSTGPLSQVNDQTADGTLEIRYERFSRNGAEDEIIVTAHGAPGQFLRLALGGRLLEGFSIEALNPQPAPLTSDGRDLIIPMLADRKGVATLYLTIRSNGMGLYQGYVRLNDGEHLAVPKFVYP